MKDKYVVGFISSPHPHSGFHIKSLEVLDIVKEIHFCGIDGEDIEKLTSNSKKIFSVTNNIDEILKIEDIDAFIVCVRNDLAPEILNSVIDAGKSILLEKPGALTATDLESVAIRAKKRSVSLSMMFQNRYQPKVISARSAILDGALGKVMAVEARMVTSQVRYRNPNHWLFGKETGGSGILGWLGCHSIDLMAHMMNDRVTEVTAMLGNQNPEKLEVEDTAMLTLKFASGTLGSLHAGYHLAGSGAGYSGAAYDSFLAFRGIDGNIRIDMQENSYTVYSEVEAWRSGGLRRISFDPPISEAYGGVGGEIFLQDFLKSAREGTQGPIPIESGVNVLKIIEAAVESSNTGKSIKI